MKNWEEYDAKKAGDKELIFDHSIVHMWWKSPEKRPKGCTDEDVKRLHEEIVKEMERRNIKHDSPLKYERVQSFRQEPLGDEISLEQVTQCFQNPIILSKGFVNLVGGLPNRGKTDGDIDLLIKWPEDVPDEIIRPVEFRLGRAMPPELSERVQFLLDRYHGPFTNHMPLYDLVLAPTKQEMVLMEGEWIETPVTINEQGTRQLAKLIPENVVFDLAAGTLNLARIFAEEGKIVFASDYAKWSDILAKALIMGEEIEKAVEICKAFDEKRNWKEWLQKNRLENVFWLGRKDMREILNELPSGSVVVFDTPRHLNVYKKFETIEKMLDSSVATITKEQIEELARAIAKIVKENGIKLYLIWDKNGKVNWPRFFEDGIVEVFEINSGYKEPNLVFKIDYTEMMSTSEIKGVLDEKTRQIFLHCMDIKDTKSLIVPFAGTGLIIYEALKQNPNLVVYANDFASWSRVCMNSLLLGKEEDISKVKEKFGLQEFPNYAVILAIVKWKNNREQGDLKRMAQEFADKYKPLDTKNVVVMQEDARDFVKKVQGELAFVDPPKQLRFGGTLWQYDDLDTLIEGKEVKRQHDINLNELVEDVIKGLDTKKVFVNLLKGRNPKIEEFKVKEIVKFGGDTLVLIEKEEMSKSSENDAKRSIEENEIKPLRYFYPLKATMGYHEGEVYNLNQILSWFKYPNDFPLILQKKYDGLRIVWMKDGDEVIAYTDDGERCEDRFPTMVKILKELPINSVVLDSETEGWSGDEHWGREVTSGYVHEKGAPDDRNFVANVFDVLYIDGLPAHHELNIHGDLHKEPYEVRLRVLEYLGSLANWQKTDEVPKSPGFNIVKSYILEKDNVKELQKLLEHIRNVPGSEGVMIKSAKGDYPLTGHTNTWLKYKKSADVHAIIIDRLPTKTKDVFRYRVGVLVPPGYNAPKKSVVDIELKNGKQVKVLDLGKTFNSKEKLEQGDIVTVMFHTLFVYNDGRVKIYEPLLYEVRPEQIIPDTVTDLINVAKQAKIIQKKEFSIPEVLVTTLCAKSKAVENGVFATPIEIWGHLPFFRKFFEACKTFGWDGSVTTKYGFSRLDDVIEAYDEKPENFAQRFIDALKKEHPKYLIIYENRFAYEGVRDGLEEIKKFGEKVGTKVFVVASIEEIYHLHWLAEKYLERYVTNFSLEKKFGLQFHFRGETVHADLRIKEENKLEGWTLAIQEEKEIGKKMKWTVEKDGDLRKVYWDKELYYVYDMKEDKVVEWNKSLNKKILDEHKKLTKECTKCFKIDLKTGKPKERLSSDGKKIVEKIWATPKQDEPVEWLEVEGVYPPREIEPVPGGTRFWPGVFVMVDRGNIEFGAQKPYFKEYFFNGKVFKGRYVLRLINRAGNMQWLFWKADDETPYVISKRAVKIGWITPYGQSGLPAEIEKKVPEELRWWEVRDKKEAKKRRDEFVKTVKMEGKCRWLLQYQWWKQVEVIRKGPSKEKWFFRAIMPNGVTEIEMKDNPFEKRTSGIVRKVQYDEFWDIGENVKVEVPPGTKYNDTKDTMSWLMTVESGECEVLEDDALVRKFNLGNGKVLLVTRASPDENVWEVKVDVGAPD